MVRCSESLEVRSIEYSNGGLFQNDLPDNHLCDTRLWRIANAAAAEIKIATNPCPNYRSCPPKSSTLPNPKPSASTSKQVPHLHKIYMDGSSGCASKKKEMYIANKMKESEQNTAALQ